MKEKIIHAADLFCGSGGTTTGLKRTCKKLGFKLKLLALNHWKIAVASHKANYPDVEHLCESIDSVDPRKAIPGGHLNILLASPECVFFSNARGGGPCSPQSRATAWHILRWCDALQVDNVLIENVREFKKWGRLKRVRRLNKKTKKMEYIWVPDKRYEGETYQAFLTALRSLGYIVEERILNAADFGGVTTRTRLFVHAKRGNKAPHWPERTHAPAEELDKLSNKRLKPWRAAREIIDWDLHGKSIFNRKKPLAPNTMKRIAAGMKKFCGIDMDPFFIMMYGTGTSRSINRPLPTVTASGNHIALAEPFLVNMKGKSKTRAIGQPVPTITAGAPHVYLAEPFILGQQSCAAARSTKKPMPTVCTAGAIRLVEPFIVGLEHTGANGAQVRSTKKPFPTITGHPRIGIVQPWLLPNEGFYRGNQSRSINKPVPIITAGRGGGNVVMPFIVEVNHSDAKNGNPAVRTHSINEPLPGITTKNGKGVVESFLVEFHRTGKARSLKDPLKTQTTHDRFALVEPTPVVNGDKQLHLDIRLRMLTPHELSLAMGFPANYKFTGNKTEQVKQIGNAVQVDLAEKLTYAILSH